MLCSFLLLFIILFLEKVSLLWNCHLRSKNPFAQRFPIFVSFSYIVARVSMIFLNKTNMGNTNNVIQVPVNKLKVLT